MKTVSSWASTARMVSEALTDGKVLAHYAARTYEAALKNLQDERSTLEKATDIPAEQRTAAQDRINRLAQVISQLKAAAEQNDRAALSQLGGQLVLEDEALKSSLKGGAGRP